MPTQVVSLALIVVCAATLGARAETISIGDSPPPLSLSKVIKGEKPDKLIPDKTYVVEFWATWCGPCIASFPHLTELQRKYDKVQFIGVNVLEQDQAKVEPFVKAQGEKMGYTVAMDVVAKGAGPDEGKMFQTWLSAAGEDGIPCAFLVHKGKIAWIGHPMKLDEPLEKVAAGDWNFEAAASERREAKAKQQKMKALFSKIDKLGRAHKEKEAIALVDEAVAENPKLENGMAQLKFKLLLQSGDDKSAADYGAKVIATSVKDNAPFLNFMAWQIVDPENKVKAGPGCLKLALQAATRANELTKVAGPDIVDTLAKVHFDLGNITKAVELQEKAVKLARETVKLPEQIMKEMAGRLEQYREAAQEKR